MFNISGFSYADPLIIISDNQLQYNNTFRLICEPNITPNDHKEISKRYKNLFTITEKYYS